jgi:hypothetical protein
MILPRQALGVLARYTATLSSETPGRRQGTKRTARATSEAIVGETLGAGPAA